MELARAWPRRLDRSIHRRVGEGVYQTSVKARNVFGRLCFMASALSVRVVNVRTIGPDVPHDKLPVELWRARIHRVAIVLVLLNACSTEGWHSLQSVKRSSSAIKAVALPCSCSTRLIVFYRTVLLTDRNLKHRASTLQVELRSPISPCQIHVPQVTDNDKLKEDPTSLASS